MTPVEKYLARLYEQAVDAQLDVEAIRHRLAACGIRRSPAQVAYELETTYGFIGYAIVHPACPVPSVQAWDAAVGY